MIKQKNEHEIFRTVKFKYLIMRVRAKISFMAFEKRMTVVEFFVHTIQKCYRHLMASGAIPMMDPEAMKKEIMVYSKLVTRGIRGSLINICDFNWGNLTEYDRMRVGGRMTRIKRK